LNVRWNVSKERTPGKARGSVLEGSHDVQSFVHGVQKRGVGCPRGIGEKGNVGEPKKAGGAAGNPAGTKRRGPAQLGSLKGPDKKSARKVWGEGTNLARCRDGKGNNEGRGKRRDRNEKPPRVGLRKRVWVTLPVVKGACTSR